MLPLLVLRRVDAVLAPTKDAVLDTAVKTGVVAAGRNSQVKTPDNGSDRLLKRSAGQRF